MTAPRVRSAARLRFRGDSAAAAPAKPGIDAGPQIRAPNCGQQPNIETRRFGKVGKQGTGVREFDARTDEPLRQSTERRPHHARGTAERMRVDDENAEVLEVIVPGGGQSQPVAGAGAFLVRSGDHIERKREIRGASGHWTDDPEIAMARQGRDARRGQPAVRHKTQCRLVRIDAAIMRWRAQRTATVRADATAARNRKQAPPPSRPRILLA